MNWLQEQKGLMLRQQVINGALFVYVVDAKTKEPLSTLFKFEDGVLKLNEDARQEIGDQCTVMEMVDLGLKFQVNGAVQIESTSI